jgi:hypothetical protein
LLEEAFDWPIEVVDLGHLGRQAIARRLPALEDDG